MYVYYAECYNDKTSCEVSSSLCTAPKTLQRNIRGETPLHTAAIKVGSMHVYMYMYIHVHCTCMHVHNTFIALCVDVSRVQ